MDNSVYISLSRELAVFRDMAATANNLANVDTPGYNAEKVMFTDYLVDDGNRHKMAFAQDIASYRDTSNGPMKVTGNPFDLAINGPGYFIVETPLGERYTKAGNFTVGPEGVLMTPTGNPVLDNGGETIIMENTDRNITVGENGIVSAKNPFGGIEERGQVGLVEFEDEQAMDRLDSQLYKTDQQPLEPINSRILQGTLESANVSAVTELVRMTELSRATSGTAKFIEVMYDLQRKTTNVYAKQGG